MSETLFEQVDSALRSVDCDIGAAECHGILVGMLCSGTRFDMTAWLAHVSAAEDGGGLGSGDQRAALDALLVATRQGLQDEDFAFELLLPPEAAALAERAAGFADWCRGFLAGCGLAGVVDPATLGEDGREFLHDVARFCRLGLADDDDEENERALTELIEFTRMGVLVLTAELHDRTADGGTPQTAQH
ncbi:MAG: UPF0149 family protein [Gammaproteobacteria bacterium]